MKDGLTLSKLLEEVRVLVFQESYFLGEVGTVIEPIIDRLSKCNEEIAFNYLSSVSKLKKKKTAQVEQNAIAIAMNLKIATENVILLREVQKKKGMFKKIPFLSNGFMDQRRAIRKLVELGSEDQIKRALQANVDDVYVSDDDDLSLVDPHNIPHDTDEVVVGRDEAITAIRTKLISTVEGQETSLHVVSIWGYPGTGKTAVARKVFHDAKVRSHFDCFAWIYNGYSYAKKSHALLKDLLSQLTMGSLTQNGQPASKLAAASDDDDDEENEDVDELSKKLYDYLKDKRYLIVIDNYGRTPAWDELFIGKESPSRGLDQSRILTTSTFFDNEFPNYQEIGPLSDASSWEMFVTKVSNTTTLMLPPDVLPIAKQLVETCGGSPMAIESLVYELSRIGSTYDSWPEILKTRTKRSKERNLDQIISSLPLHLKNCFSYLQLFPKNYEIPVRRLIALWIAEEDIVIPKDGSALEKIGKEYVEELIDREIIQVKQYKVDGRPKTCCLNQLWHKRMLSSSARQPNSDGSSTIGTRQLNVNHTSEIQSRILDSKNFEPYRFLFTFLCFDYRRSFEPSRHITQFLSSGIDRNCLLFLTVLDLEGVYKPILPKEMKRLTNLRYLGLRWTYIDSLPSFIGNLINLRTLDVKHTYVNTFPKWICKLEHLQHLYMSEHHRGKFVYRAGSLEKLQTRGGSMEKLETLWGIFVDDKSNVKDGLDRLTGIRNLGLTFRLTSQSDNAVANWVLKLHGLESLRLKSKNQFDKPSLLRLMPFQNHMQLSKLYLLGELERPIQEYAFPPCLGKLTLSASKLTKDPMPILGLLSCLTVLRLYSDSYIGHRMVCTSSSFAQLQVLKMWKLEQLSEWTVEEGSMPTLKELDIRSCKGLNMLPVELQNITTIEELKLADMSKVFTEQVKDDKRWPKKCSIRLTDLDKPRTTSTVASSITSNSRVVTAAGASPIPLSTSSIGYLVLDFLLVRRGMHVSPTKHTKLKKPPPALFILFMLSFWLGAECMIRRRNILNSMKHTKLPAL